MGCWSTGATIGIALNNDFGQFTIMKINFLPSLIIGILVMTFGCKNSENIKESNKAFSNSVSLTDTSYEVSSQSEKIALLSVMQNVNYDTLFNILNDYYSIQMPENRAFDLSDGQKTLQRIDSISNKYNFSKRKISRLIYSFIYFKFYDEDVKESAINDLSDNANSDN